MVSCRTLNGGIALLQPVAVLHGAGTMLIVTEEPVGLKAGWQHLHVH